MNTARKQVNKRTTFTKKLIVEEYKKRLKDNVKSLNENFLQILSAGKVNVEDGFNKNNFTSRMTDYKTVAAEMSARAALMMKATDELLILTNDIREFLILRDFNFLSLSIANAEKRVKGEMEQQEQKYDLFRHKLASIIADLDNDNNTISAMPF